MCLHSAKRFSNNYLQQSVEVLSHCLQQSAAFSHVADLSQSAHLSASHFVSQHSSFLSQSAQHSAAAFSVFLELLQQHDEAANTAAARASVIITFLIIPFVLIEFPNHLSSSKTSISFMRPSSILKRKAVRTT